MAFDRLRRLLPDLDGDGTGRDRAVDSVRHGGDDWIDADPGLDRAREDSPDEGGPRSDPDGQGRTRSRTRSGTGPRRP